MKGNFLTLKMKIVGGLLLILCVTLIVQLHLIFGSYSIRNNAKEIKDITFPALEQASYLLSLVKETKELIVESIDEEGFGIDETVIEDLMILRKKFRNAVTMITAEAEDSDIEIILQSYESYSDVAINVFNIIIDEGIEGVPSEILEKNQAAELDTQITTYREKKLAMFTKALNDIKYHTASFRLTSYFSGMFGLLIIILVSLVAEQIFMNIDLLLQSTKNFIHRDYSKAIHVNRNDELGVLQRAFEEMRKSLHQQNSDTL